MCSIVSILGAASILMVALDGVYMSSRGMVGVFARLQSGAKVPFIRVGRRAALQWGPLSRNVAAVAILMSMPGLHSAESAMNVACWVGLGHVVLGLSRLRRAALGGPRCDSLTFCRRWRLRHNRLAGFVCVWSARVHHVVTVTVNVNSATCVTALLAAASPPVIINRRKIQGFLSRFTCSDPHIDDGAPREFQGFHGASSSNPGM